MTDAWLGLLWWCWVMMMMMCGVCVCSGVITAALYLESFLKKRSKPGASQHRATPWVHVDFNAANAGARPGRPEGGDPQGMRALFELVKEVSSKGGWPVDQDEEPPADDAAEDEGSP